MRTLSRPMSGMGNARVWLGGMGYACVCWRYAMREFRHLKGIIFTEFLEMVEAAHSLDFVDELIGAAATEAAATDLTGR